MCCQSFPDRERRNHSASEETDLINVQGITILALQLPFPCTLIKSCLLPKGGVIPPLAVGKGFDSTFLG